MLNSDVDDAESLEELEAVETFLTRGKTPVTPKKDDDEDDSDLVPEIEDEGTASRPAKGFGIGVKSVESDPLLKELISQLNWKAAGERIKAYRTVMGLSTDEFAVECDMDPGTVTALEAGNAKKSANNLWEIVKKTNVSVAWLFKGEGKFSDKTPHLLPISIVHDRGAGIRRTQERLSAEEGTFSDDPLEFVMAIDAYKRVNHVVFPSWTEVLEVAKALGYRKVAPATINPRRNETLIKKKKETV